MSGDLVSRGSSPPVTGSFAKQLYCEICLKQDKGEKMLICDGCDCGERRRFVAIALSVGR